jgi:hypothetical protein
MVSLRTGFAMGAAGLLAIGVGAGASHVGAQSAADSPQKFKSVYGKLESINDRQNGVIMMSEAGDRLAWRFAPKVIASLARFELDSPMIVIYRQISANEKRVTAVAFPGTAQTPTYINLTGARVVLRSGPEVDGTCGPPSAGPIQETMILDGGQAETSEACWCCAAPGEACTPGNKTGLGQALLVQCFE